MSEHEIPESVSADYLAIMTNAADQARDFAGVIIAYRRTLVEGGVAENNADIMASQYQHYLLTVIQQAAVAAQRQSIAHLVRALHDDDDDDF